MPPELHFGTTSVERLDAGAEFVLAELKAANYGARAGQAIVGNLGRDARGHWVRIGAAGPSRDSGALVREAGRDARQLAATLPKTRGGRGRKAPKGKQPKQTPEEKRQAREEQRAANRDAVFGTLQVDGDIQASLLKLANGGQPDGDVGGIVDAGLAVRDAEGQYRLTPQGRALFAAASAGDAGRARDALSLGHDRVIAAAQRQEAAQTRQQAREQRQQEREQQRAQRQQEREQRQEARAAERASRASTAAGAGADGSGPIGPERLGRQEQQAQNARDVRDAMESQGAGLAPAAFDALSAFAAGDGMVNADTLQALADETGLLDVGTTGDFRLTSSGRQFLAAARRGDVRGALDTLSRSIDKLAAASADATATEAPMPPAAKMLNADGIAHPGAMIAFLLDDASATALIEACAGLDVAPDHLTLVYLAPNASDLDAQKNALVGELAELAGCTPPISGVINGYGRFSAADGEDQALYANFDSPELPELFDELMECVESCDCDTQEREHGFTPHITLTYLTPDAPTPTLQLPQIPITFDRIALVWAGETITLPLCGDDAEEEDDQPSEGLAALAAALGATTDGAPLPMDDTMIYPGESVKSLGDGRIGGYLVRFGSPAHTDLAGDFFTEETDFGILPGAKTAVYFNHRLPLKTAYGQPIEVKEQIGEGTLRLDRYGVLIDAVLYNRKQYQAMLDQLDWSSGTAAHLVDRVAFGKAAWLKKWPLGLDASLTPTPCEPGARAMPAKAIPLKSYVPQTLTQETSPEAATAAAAGEARVSGAPSVIKSQQETTAMDQGLRDELKSMFDEAFKNIGAKFGDIEAKMDGINNAVNDRLKAFEDSPALKSSGFVSQDGGSADKNIKSFADWLFAVRRGDTKRLATVYKSGWTDFSGDSLAVKDLNEATGGSGGYMVPVEYEPMLARISAEQAIIEPRARKIQMGSAIRKVPMLKQTATPGTGPGNSAFFGGMTFTWEPEAADISADKSDPSYEMVEYIARKLVGMTVSSAELTEDAPQLEAELTQLFGEGLAHAKDYFYLRGSGVGQPLGILNAPALRSVTRAASGNNVDLADVAGLAARMVPGGLSSALWISHPLNVADLISLTIGQQPVFQPDIKAAIGGLLLNLPLAFSEYLPAPGTAGDFGLYALQFYGCGIRRGIAIAMSEHARFDKDQITWKITYRGDGKPLIDNTIKLADGSNTVVSPFVALS